MSDDQLTQDLPEQTRIRLEKVAQWRELGTVAGEKYADITDYYIDAYKVTSPHLGGCALHDPLAAAAAVDH